MTQTEGELDLKPYLLVLINRWRWIAAIAIMTSIIAIGVSYLLPKQYRTAATILVSRSRVTLALAEQFPTITEPIDTRSRMDAIQTIAGSDGIAVSSQQKLAQSSVIMALEDLKDEVSISLNGDVVQITANANNPQLAAEIANTWANEAVNTINQAYSGEQPLTEIQRQLSDTNIEYSSAQAAVEEFLATNRIDMLRSQYLEAQNILTGLTDDRASRVVYHNNRIEMLEAMIIQAEALKNQLETNPASDISNAGDALAVLLFRANAFGLPVSVDDLIPLEPSRIELQVENLLTLNDSDQINANDLEKLITLVEVEINKSTIEMDILIEAFLKTSNDPRLVDISGQLSELQAELEQENSRLLELKSERDLAWDAYQALAQKEVEIRNAAPTDYLVTIVSPAIPPVEPSSPNVLINGVVGFSLGIFSGIFWVITLQWWQSIEFSPPNKPEKKLL